MSGRVRQVEMPSALPFAAIDVPALAGAADVTEAATFPVPVPAPGAVLVFDLRTSGAPSASAVWAPASVSDGEMRSLRIGITAWSDFAALPRATIRLATTALATDATGLAVLEVPVAGSQTLELAFSPGDAAQAEADAAVTLQDAVAVLRLLAGPSATAGRAQAPSRWALEAADFDCSGLVSPADAIGVLRHAVGQPAPRPAWVFFNRGTGAGTVMSASAVDEQAPVSQITVDVTAGGSVSLVGVLRGDVDGRAAIGRFGLQAVDNGAWALKGGHADVSVAVGAGDLVLSVPDGQAARLPLGDMGVLDLAGARLRIGDGVVDLVALGSDRCLSDVGALTVDGALCLSLSQWQQALAKTPLLSGRGSVEVVIHATAQAQALLQILDGARFESEHRKFKRPLQARQALGKPDTTA